jgi:uncharacterized protein (DUF4415 family)
VKVINTMLRQGKSQTDWARVDAMTEAELSTTIDTAEEGEFDWSAAQVGIPSPKKQVTILLDADVLDWFKAQGSGYQMRINPVLRHYVETQRRQKKARVSRR